MKKTLGLIFALLMASTSIVSAAFIDGKLEFTGITAGATETTLVFDGSGTDVSNVTGIDFGDFFGIPGYSQMEVTLGTSGDFADFVSFGDFVTVSDIDFTALPQAEIWSVGGFSMELISVGSIILEPIGPADTWTMLGTGIVTGNGFDATEMSWDFSLTEGSLGTVTFTSVPEPSSLALLGLGLIGLGAARRRQKS